jgi:thiol:disulfide interchange protein DsbA
MKRRDFSATLLATGAGLALSPAAFAQGGPVEGRQYQRLGNPLPTTPGKIEVIEFFWYGCAHCAAFDPMLETWVKKLPADVSFRRAHVGFNGLAKLHQRMFYALEAMGKEVAVHEAIFNAFHRERYDASDDKSIIALMGRYGLDTAKFKEAYESFGVRTKAQQATKLSEAYNLEGVPTLAIGGRFTTSPSMAGPRGTDELNLGAAALSVTDFLIQRVRSKA